MSGDWPNEAETRLREEASKDFPDAWIPSEQEPELSGIFERLSSGTTAYGKAWIAVFRMKDGTERAVWLLHTVLRNELARVKPAPGELVLIRWEGKKQSGSGSSYDSYRVVVDRPETEASWNEISTVADFEPAAPAGGEDDGGIPF